MLGWFRKIHVTSTAVGLVASQPPGEIFAWPRETRLTALDEAVLALPKALLGPNEVINFVIRGNDDMEISIPEEGEVLFLRLQPGMTVSLTKSCQSYVVSDDGQPRRFRISGPATQAKAW